MPRHQVQRTSFRSYFPYKVDNKNSKNNKHLLPPPPSSLSNNSFVAKSNSSAYFGCPAVEEKCLRKKSDGLNSLLQESEVKAFCLASCLNSNFSCFPSETSMSAATCFSSVCPFASSSRCVHKDSLRLSSPPHASVVCGLDYLNLRDEGARFCCGNVVSRSRNQPCGADVCSIHPCYGASHHGVQKHAVDSGFPESLSSCCGKTRNGASESPSFSLKPMKSSDCGLHNVAANCEELDQSNNNSCCGIRGEKPVTATATAALVEETSPFAARNFRTFAAPHTPTVAFAGKPKRRMHRNHFRASSKVSSSNRLASVIVPSDPVHQSSPLLSSAPNPPSSKFNNLSDVSTCSAPPTNNASSSFLSSFSYLQSDDQCVKSHPHYVCDEVNPSKKKHFTTHIDNKKYYIMSPYFHPLTNNSDAVLTNQEVSFICPTSSSFNSVSLSSSSNDAFLSSSSFIEDFLQDDISTNNPEADNLNTNYENAEVKTSSYEDMLKSTKNLNTRDFSSINSLSFDTEKDSLNSMTLQTKSNAILNLEKVLFKVKSMSCKFLKENDKQSISSEKSAFERTPIIIEQAKENNSIEDNKSTNCKSKIKENSNNFKEVNTNNYIVRGFDGNSSSETFVQNNVKNNFHSKFSDLLNSWNSNEDYRRDLTQHVFGALSTLSSLSNENDFYNETSNDFSKNEDNESNKHEVPNKVYTNQNHSNEVNNPMCQRDSLNFTSKNFVDSSGKNLDNTTAQVNNKMNFCVEHKNFNNRKSSVRLTKLISLKSNSVENKNNNCYSSKNNKAAKSLESLFSNFSLGDATSSSSFSESCCSTLCNDISSNQNNPLCVVQSSAYCSASCFDEEKSNRAVKENKTVECAHLRAVCESNNSSVLCNKAEKAELKEGTHLVKKSKCVTLQARNSSCMNYSEDRKKLSCFKKKAEEDQSSNTVKVVENEAMQSNKDRNDFLVSVNQTMPLIPCESSLPKWFDELNVLKYFLSENKCFQSLNILNCLLEIVVETRNNTLIEDVLKLYDKYNLEKDIRTFNILLSCYAKQNLVTHVEEILHVVSYIYNKIHSENSSELPTNDTTNIVSSYLKIIEAFVQMNHIKEAVQYIHKMKTDHLDDEHISIAINLLFKLSYEKHLMKDALYALYPSVSNLQNKLDLQLIHTNEVGLININSILSNITNDSFPLPQTSLDYLLQYCVLNKDKSLLLLVESLAAVFNVQYSLNSLDLCIKFYSELKCARAIYLFEKLSEEFRVRGLQKNGFLLEYVNVACKNEYTELIEKILAFSKSCNDEDAYFTCLILAIQMYGEDELSKVDVSGNVKSSDGKLNYTCMLRDYLQKENYLRYLELLKNLEDSGQYICLSTRNVIIEIIVNHSDVKTAHQILLNMKNKNMCNVISFNHVIKGYCILEDLNSALKLYYEMKSIRIEANCETFNYLINCAILKSQEDVIINLINELHRKRVKVGKGILDTLMNVLRLTLNRKHIEKVLDIVDEALENNENVAETNFLSNEELVFNTLLDACVKIKDTNRMLKIIKKFRNKNMQFDLQTYGILIKAFGSCGKINECKLLWIDFANQRGLEPNDVTYGCMFDALVNNNKVDEAVLLFDEMKQKRKIKPNTIMYSTIIKGFAQAKQLDSALRIYDEMKSSGTPINAVTYNSIVDACARVGSMHTAISLLEEMLANGVEPDLITFSTIIKGYCVLGDIDKSLQLLRAMTKRGIKSDGILYNSLLDGCVKAAKSELCEELWNEMRSNGIAPSNFTLTILIKMYGRTGQLDKAFNLVHELPTQYGFEINAHVYTCLMSACITNRKFEMAYDVFHCMQRDGIKPDAKTYETIIYGCTKGAQYKQAVELVEQAFGFKTNSLLSTSVSVSSFIPHPNAIGYKLEHRTYRYLLQQLQNNKHELYDPLVEKLRRYKIFVHGNSKVGSHNNNHEKRV